MTVTPTGLVQRMWISPKSQLTTEMLVCPLDCTGKGLLLVAQTCNVSLLGKKRYETIPRLP